MACPVCGVEFTRSYSKNHMPRNCSRACANRSNLHRASVSLGRRGKLAGSENPSFKGVSFQTRDGVTRAFVWVSPEERQALGITSRDVRRSHYVWLKAHPGETIKRGEVIHHDNDDALDDRPENLVKLSSAREHAVVHAAKELRGFATRERLPDHPCEHCGQPVRPWRKFCSIACRAAVKRGEGHPSKGREWPEEMRQRISTTLTGRKASPETREKMRQAHLAQWAARKADG